MGSNPTLSATLSTDSETARPEPELAAELPVIPRGFGVSASTNPKRRPPDVVGDRTKTARCLHGRLLWFGMRRRLDIPQLDDRRLYVIEGAATGRIAAQQDEDRAPYAGSIRAASSRSIDAKEIQGSPGTAFFLWSHRQLVSSVIHWGPKRFI